MGSHALANFQDAFFLNKSLCVGLRYAPSQDDARLHPSTRTCTDPNHVHSSCFMHQERSTTRVDQLPTRCIVLDHCLSTSPRLPTVGGGVRILLHRLKSPVHLIRDVELRSRNLRGSAHDAHAVSHTDAEGGTGALAAERASFATHGRHLGRGKGQGRGRLLDASWRGCQPSETIGRLGQESGALPRSREAAEEVGSAAGAAS